MRMVMPYLISGLAPTATRTGDYLKTTINLNHQLLRRAKRQASSRGITLARFIEDALRAQLMDGDREPPAFKLNLKTVRGHAPPNVDIADRKAVHDVLDWS